MYFRVNIRALITWAASQLSESKSYEYLFDYCTYILFPQFLKFIKMNFRASIFIFCRLTTLVSLAQFSPLFEPPLHRFILRPRLHSSNWATRCHFGFYRFSKCLLLLSFNSRYFPHLSIYIFSTVYILPSINHLNLRVVSFHFFGISTFNIPYLNLSFLPVPISWLKRILFIPS